MNSNWVWESIIINYYSYAKDSDAQLGTDNKCDIQFTPGLATSAPYPVSFYDVWDNSWDKYAILPSNGALEGGSYIQEYGPSRIFR